MPYRPFCFAILIGSRFSAILDLFLNGQSLKSPATGRGSDVYIERLRERLQLVESESQKAVDHLSELDKVKLHANAKIRDGERLLKSSKLKEKEVQKLLDASKSKACANMPHKSNEYKILFLTATTAPAGGGLVLYTLFSYGIQCMFASLARLRCERTCSAYLSCSGEMSQAHVPLSVPVSERCA